MADTIEYLEKIRAFANGKGPILAQAETIDGLAALLCDVPESDSAQDLRHCGTENCVR